MILEIAEDIPPEIVSDAKRIKLIVLNLLSNAIKFTETGYVKLKIGYSSKEHGLIEIAVEDTGLGMNEKNLGKLRKLLSKVDLSEKISSNSAGCGFGLTISQIVSMRLGEEEQGIEVRSEIDKGSQFFFTIRDQREIYNDIQRRVMDSHG